MQKTILWTLASLTFIAAVVLMIFAYINYKDWKDFAVSPSNGSQAKPPLTKKVATNQPANPQFRPRNQPMESNNIRENPPAAVEPTVNIPEISDQQLEIMEDYREAYKALKSEHREMRKEMKNNDTPRQERNRIRKEMAQEVQKLKLEYGVTPEIERAYQMHRIQKIKQARRKQQSTR